MHVSGLYRYPVKSMRGAALGSAVIERIGVAGDRRWMVVDERGRFVTRREAPMLGQIVADLDQGGITLRHPSQNVLFVETPTAGRVAVKIWKDSLELIVAADAAGAFISAVIGRTVRLVYMPDSVARAVDPNFSLAGDAVNLADGHPILITTEESLAALNARLRHPVEMQRFRPNIVLSGAASSWAEDTWRRIRIGGLDLRIVKPCSRCAIVTQDSLSGECPDGSEPLKTLRAMGRASAMGVIFGQNAIPDTVAQIALGDAVEIVECGRSNLFAR